MFFHGTSFLKTKKEGKVLLPFSEDFVPVEVTDVFEFHFLLVYSILLLSLLLHYAIRLIQSLRDERTP
jgi:hypothetical protein